jgi:ubiquinone/menaquinone biosynthesis C-methylase UbiE
MTGWHVDGYNIASKMQYVSGMKLWDTLMQNYSLNHENTLLDIGCGNGNYIFDMLEKTPQISYACGVDLSENMLNIARQKCIERQIKNFDFMYQDIAIFNPQLSNKFNIAYSNYCLHWVGNKILALNNILEYLKSGGIFALKIGQPGLIRLALHMLNKEKKWQQFNLLKNYVNHDIEHYDPLSYELNFYQNYFNNAPVKTLKCELNIKTHEFANNEEMRSFIRYGIIPFTIPDDIADEFIDAFINVSKYFNNYTQNTMWLADIDIIGKKY